MVMSDAFWELLPHGADMGIQGTGPSKAAAFEQAGIALTAIVTDPTCVTPKEPVTLSCTAPDDELLLVEWLNALIFEMATRKMLFARFEVRFENHSLVGTAWGEAIDLAPHEPGVEIKGATCTNLKVAQDESGRWSAQCVVDV
jgi:tRNA nucleotidyltransferase (CCA-adding enzyme)